jgi:SAM-dependent methyltransferase
MSRPTSASLRERVARFDYWHYAFDLGEVVINPEGVAAQQAMRESLWPAVLEVCGGSLRGLRVLDVGCNAGFWSLEAHRSGAEYVLGVDARPIHVEQAELVRDALGVDPARLAYRCMNIYDLAPSTIGQFDLCLLLRVVHHLRHPLLALDRLRNVCGSFLVADVRVLRGEQERVLRLKGEDEDNVLHGVEGLSFKPSISAFELMLRSSGFTDIRRVPPRPSASRAYIEGSRAIFTAVAGGTAPE